MSKIVNDRCIREMFKSSVTNTYGSALQFTDKEDHFTPAKVQMMFEMFVAGWLSAEYVVEATDIPECFKRKGCEQ